eukprot:5959746-Pyramimonas_sp.AAC.1
MDDPRSKLGRENEPIFQGVRLMLAYPVPTIRGGIFRVKFRKIVRTAIKPSNLRGKTLKSSSCNCVEVETS